MIGVKIHLFRGCCAHGHLRRLAAPIHEKARPLLPRIARSGCKSVTKAAAGAANRKVECAATVKGGAAAARAGGRSNGRAFER